MPYMYHQGCSLFYQFAWEDPPVVPIRGAC